jgi:hypothetical protein
LTSEKRLRKCDREQEGELPAGIYTAMQSVMESICNFQQKGKAEDGCIGMLESLLSKPFCEEVKDAEGSMFREKKDEFIQMVSLEQKLLCRHVSLAPGLERLQEGVNVMVITSCSIKFRMIASYERLAYRRHATVIS